MSKTAVRRSLACGTCKKRKIKCDLTQGACHNCVKAGWTCPGYPTQTDLVFYDQTQKIIHQLRRPIVLSNTDRGLQYFLGHHVINNAQVAINLSSSTATDSLQYALRLASTAVGLFELCSLGYSSEAHEQYIKNYMRAVQILNSCLSQPDVIQEELLLVTIYTLAVFGDMTVEDDESNSRGNVHLEAAATILGLRGPDLFSSVDSIRISMQIVTSLAISCIEAEQYLPATVRLRTECLRSSMTLSDAFCESFFALLDLVDLLATASRPLTVHSACGLMARLQTLDAVYERLTAKALREPCWQFVRRATWPYGRMQDVFPNYLVAEFWFGLWTSRMLVASTMIRTAKTVYGDLPPKQVVWTLIHEDAVDGILNNVLQHLMSTTNTTRAMPTRFLWENHAPVIWQNEGLQPSNRKVPMLRSMGGFIVLHSLRAIGHNQNASNRQRLSAASILDTIATQMHVRRARTFADGIRYQVAHSVKVDAPATGQSSESYSAPR